MSFDNKPLKNEGLDNSQESMATEPCLGGAVESNPSNLAVQSNRNDVARYAETVPSKFRPNYIKATGSSGSKAAAIKAKCLNCVGYEDAVNRIRNCSSATCPLWACRPFQK